MQPVADSACPVCGSAPITSSVVGWAKAHKSLLCTCSLCTTIADDVATLWLDMLMAKHGWKQVGQNVFLLGY